MKYVTSVPEVAAVKLGNVSRNLSTDRAIGPLNPLPEIAMPQPADSLSKPPASRGPPLWPLLTFWTMCALVVALGVVLVLRAWLH